MNAARLKLRAALPKPALSRAKIKSLSVIAFIGLIAFLFGLYFKNLIPIAFVNGQPVTRKMFAERLIRTSGDQILEELIINSLTVQELERKGVVVTQYEIDSKIALMDRQLQREGKTLNEALTEAGSTRADLERELESQLGVEKLLRSKVRITDDDIDTYLQENGIEKGKGAILESQKIAIHKVLYRAGLREKYEQWLVGLLKKANIKRIIKF